MLGKYNTWLKLISPIFYFCNVATRIFKITYVAHIVFLLNSASLESWWLPRKTDSAETEICKHNILQKPVLGSMLCHVPREGLSCPEWGLPTTQSTEGLTSSHVEETSISSGCPTSRGQVALPFDLRNTLLQMKPTCLWALELGQPELHLLQCLDRAGFLKSQVEHLTFFGNITSSNS